MGEVKKPIRGSSKIYSITAKEGDNMVFRNNDSG